MKGTLGDYLRDYGKITDFTKDGKCIRCGQCCTEILPLSDEELLAIKKYVKKNKIHNQHLRILNVQRDITCPLMSPKRECLIYDIRPAICQSFMCNWTQDDKHRNDMNFRNVKYKVRLLTRELYGE
jgi:Fe-S-cluster containining protein